MKKLALGTVLAVGTVMVACGSGAVVTSVPGAKAVASLTPGEKTSACQDANSYVKANFSESDAKRIYCNLLAAQTGALCSGAIIDACMQSSQVKGTVPQQPCTGLPDTSSCGTITVDDYSACVKEQVAAGKAVAGQGCSAKEPNLTGGPACSKVKAACPQILWTPG
jgi:hypothetical protein